MEEYLYILISLVFLYIAYKLKSSSMKASKELEEIGKDYLDKITKNYEKSKTDSSSSHIKQADPNYINPCVDSSDKYVGGTIPNFTIVYGTQSGTSKKFADMLKREANENLKLNCSVVNVSEIKADDLNDNALLVFIVSTYGDGGPSDDSVEFNAMINNEEFWDKIKNKKLCYAVFGLGCSFYTKFNAQAKFIDKIFNKNKVMRICELGLGDEAKNLTEDFLSWKNKIFWKKVYSYFKENEKSYAEYKSKSQKERINVDDLCEMCITKNKNEVNNEEVPITAYEHSLAKILSATLIPIESITQLRQETVNGSTLKVTFNYENTNLTYNVGDNIVIFPKNTSDKIDAICKHMQYDPNDIIFYKFKAPEATKKKLNLPLPNNITIQEAFVNYLDLSCQVNKDMLTKIKKFIADEEQYKKICNIIDNKDLLNEFLSKRYNIIDLIAEYNSIYVPFNSLIKILPKMFPRYYTVASSPNNKKNKFDIAITLVNWKNSQNKEVYGLTSNYLNYLFSNGKTDSLRIMVKGSSFKLPNDLNTPMLMMCTGTGIAPFISFLQEMNFIGKQPYETYLIFGSKNRKSDFIFESELNEYKNKKVLTELHGAFSRDGNEKTYVQDVLVKEFKSRLSQLVNDKKMIIYICGSLSMGSIVKQTISNIIGKESYDTLVNEKRLLSEFWENK